MGVPVLDAVSGRYSHRPVLIFSWTSAIADVGTVLGPAIVNYYMNDGMALIWDTNQF